MSLDDQWERSTWVGKTIAERYRVVALRRTSSRGEVYEAVDGTNANHVVLVVLQLPATAAATTAAAGLIKGGEANALFAHANIAPLLEVGRIDDRTWYMVNELVRGISLRTHLEGGIDQRKALMTMRQVLLALAAAHDQGVVHRDIAPENIKITKGNDGSDLVKVLDFGVAKLIGDAGWTSALGDLRYISPECALERAADGRADLYSAGAVLYELLTGHPVFEADDVAALVRLHAYAPIQPLRQRAPGRTFTPELEQLVADALHKTSDKRYRSAFEMMRALDLALRSLPEPVAPAPATGRAKTDSLEVIARELAPAKPDIVPLAVLANTSRTVRALPWWTRLYRFVRRIVSRLRSPKAT
jgi:eukaryotic-like serine/threonine-protein kinase